MNAVSSLQGLGYLVSTLSVMLLGIVCWKGASEHPLLLARLVAGMATSVIGMCLRYVAPHGAAREARRNAAGFACKDRQPTIVSSKPNYQPSCSGARS